MWKGVFFCDVDGTLLPQGGSEASRSMLALMASAPSQGYLFCITTGRMYHSLHMIFGSVEDKVLYGCSSGSRLFVRGVEQPGSVSIPLGLAEELGDEALAHGCAMVMSSGESLYSLGVLDARMHGFFMSQFCPDQPVSDVGVLSGPIWQITVVPPAGYRQTDGLLSLLKERFGERLTIALSGERIIDLAPADKSRSVSQVCALLSVPRERTYAFGDAQNDIPMLASAGTGYAMESGEDALKRRFPRHVTDLEATIRDIMLA